MQKELFHESFENALQATIEGIGGFKKVSIELWPGKTPDSAYAHLKNCLREDKGEKLSLSELITITKWGRDQGIHYANAFFNDETGYQRPEPLNAEDELEKREREFIEAAKIIEKVLPLIKSLKVVS